VKNLEENTLGNTAWQYHNRYLIAQYELLVYPKWLTAQTTYTCRSIIINTPVRKKLSRA